MSGPLSWLGFLLALVASPALPGIINRTKAFFAGRRGPPMLQGYYDLARLLRKGVVVSHTTTWVFGAGPAVALGATVCALLLLPFGGVPAPLGFAFDAVLFAYLLGLARLALIFAALDTGSSFEGMGASRELLFSALAEPALFLVLLVLVVNNGALSLSGLLGPGPAGLLWSRAAGAAALAGVALFVILLVENARIPFDDPNTHLELTMIHEVMILDHSGPDLALLHYAASLKLWALGSLVVGLAVPGGTGSAAADAAVALAGMVALGVAIGIVESTMARLRLPRVPHALVGAGMLAALALLLSARWGG